MGRSDIERWLESLDGLQPASRRAYLISARGFTQWLVDQGHVRRDPCAGVRSVREPRRVPRALPADDVTKLLAALPDRRAHCIVALMVWMGLRCGEVARVGLGDYDNLGRTLRVSGKGGHERVLPVPDEARRAIEAYVEEQGHRSGPMIRNYLFVGRGLSAATVSMNVAGWFRNAGIKERAFDGRTAHALRHTAASDVLDRCRDVRTVQTMLGHSNIATTSVYLRGAKLGDLREAMAGRDYRSAS